MPVDFTGQILTALMPFLFLAFVIALLGALFRNYIPKLKGRLGEAGINFMLRIQLDQEVYRLVANVTLPSPGGTTQIDHVIVSRYGIFVIETKAYTGWIYGGERDAQWTQVIYKSKQRFQNPLRQNYKHTKTLSDLTGIPHEYFKSVVAFAGDSTFKTDMPANVVKAHHLARHIKSHQVPLIKDSQVSEIATVIQEWAGTVSGEQRRQHVRNLRRSHESRPTASGAPSFLWQTVHVRKRYSIPTSPHSYRRVSPSHCHNRGHVVSNQSNGSAGCRSTAASANAAFRASR